MGKRPLEVVPYSSERFVPFRLNEDHRLSTRPIRAIPELDLRSAICTLDLVRARAIGSDSHFALNARRIGCRLGQSGREAAQTLDHLGQPVAPAQGQVRRQAQPCKQAG